MPAKRGKPAMTKPETKSAPVTVKPAEPKPTSSPAPASPQPQVAPSAPAEKPERYANMVTRTHDAKTIRLLVKENPKHGKSAERFAKYRDGMTIADALKAGVTTGDIRWDVAHRFIAVEGL